MEKKKKKKTEKKKYIYQDSTVLVKEQTLKSVEQNGRYIPK